MQYLHLFIELMYHIPIVCSMMLTLILRSSLNQTTAHIVSVQLLIRKSFQGVSMENSAIDFVES